MDRFDLTIKIGNDAMYDRQDVAQALVDVAQVLSNGGEGGTIQDENGNTVGRYGFDYHGVDVVHEAPPAERPAKRIDLARQVDEIFARPDFEPQAFFEERGIDRHDLVRIAISAAQTAHKLDTEAGIAALFVQGVQLGIALAEERTR